MFKSKIEVREYAMNKAIELMGTGTPTKQVVEKAQEIEAYVIGEADLPETVDENELINAIVDTIGIVLSQTFCGMFKEKPSINDILNYAGLKPMAFEKDTESTASETKPEPKKKK